MSRTTPMWLLCKGEKSRVRDGPASSSVLLMSVYPHRRDWLAGLASGPASWSVFKRSQKRKCEEASVCEESRVRDGSTLCFGGAL